jgi:hypothetical protein
MQAGIRGVLLRSGVKLLPMWLKGNLYLYLITSYPYAVIQVYIRGVRGVCGSVAQMASCQWLEHWPEPTLPLGRSHVLTNKSGTRHGDH